jgi:hypothetical protein
LKFSTLLACCFISTFVAAVRAQIVVLDDFSGASGAGELAGSSWVGHTTLGGGQLVVRAHDDQGWGTFSTTLDLHAMTSLTVTASQDTGNAAGSFKIYFEDNSAGIASQTFTISMSQFSPIDAMTTVTIPITWSGIDASNIAGWAIGGGGFTTSGPAFNMTLDQVSLSVSAVPEPSMWAGLAGATLLGYAAWRRRTSATPVA